MTTRTPPRYRCPPRSTGPGTRSPCSDRVLLAPGRRQLADGRAAAVRIIGGLAVADPAGTFVYADTTGNAFTFTAGATSFGTGSGSHGSLADLKIVPGQAVMLATNAVSAEPVS